MPHFADELHARVLERESQLVLGVDPHPDALWPGAIAEAGAGSPAEEASALGRPAERLARAFLAQGRALIDAAGPASVAVKFQLACFERLGAAGWSALEALVAHARDAGLVVIADGKRGDIAVSALAYAQALIGVTPSPFGPVPGLQADAITVNPLLGADAMAPFVDTALQHGRGVFVLVRTSNPGAADIQELEVAGGARVWERTAELVSRLGEGDVGSSGLSSVGAVVAATAPRHLPRLREGMPRAVFLMPGLGPQGGELEPLAPAFAAGPASALITVSRGISEAHRAGGRDSAAAARAEAERLRALIWDLAQIAR